MPHLRAASGAALVFAVVLATGCGGGDSSSHSSTRDSSDSSSDGSRNSTTVTGFVGPRKEIGFYRKPTKPGTYTFVIQDNSIAHDFKLTGPGVDRLLSTLDGMRTFRTDAVTLAKGTYRYYCDLHTDLNGSFEIR